MVAAAFKRRSAVHFLIHQFIGRSSLTEPQVSAQQPHLQAQGKRAQMASRLPPMPSVADLLRLFRIPGEDAGTANATGPLPPSSLAPDPRPPSARKHLSQNFLLDLNVAGWLLTGARHTNTPLDRVLLLSSPLLFLQRPLCGGSWPAAEEPRPGDWPWPRSPHTLHSRGSPGSTVLLLTPPSRALTFSPALSSSVQREAPRLTVIEKDTRFLPLLNVRLKGLTCEAPSCHVMCVVMNL